MISKKAAEELYAVIKNHVSMDCIPGLLADLNASVHGNNSYHETITEVIRLHILDLEKA